MISIIFALIVGFVIGGVLVYFGYRYKDNSFDNTLNKLGDVEKRFDEKTNLILNQLNDRMRENRESSERTGGHMNKQMHEFAAGISGIGERIRFMGDSLKQISSFQEIFRSPKLRGQWGEVALANILSQYFPREHYELQYHFRATNDIVDSVLKLPDGRLLSIDSKFPLDNFERDKKLFAGELKNQIDSIASKYILPSEGTLDVALMYIPAEAIYYEVIHGGMAENNFNVAAYAREKRVIPVSPNTFYLTIQAINHWYRDVTISKEAREIWKRVGKILEDSKKLEESFSKLDVHLSHARSSFDESGKRLNLMNQKMERLTGGEESS